MYIKDTVTDITLYPPSDTTLIPSLTSFEPVAQYCATNSEGVINYLIDKRMIGVGFHINFIDIKLSRIHQSTPVFKYDNSMNIHYSLTSN